MAAFSLIVAGAILAVTGWTREDFPLLATGITLAFGTIISLF